MEKVMSQATLRKRKMLLVYPLLVIPFLTMAFWALGGGQKSQTDHLKGAEKGLNTNLPDAALKGDETGGKISFYDKAAKDSAKLEEWMRTDPYYKKESSLSLPSTNDPTGMGDSVSPVTNSIITSPYSRNKNAPEDELMHKLTKLQAQLATPQEEKRSAVKQENRQTNRDEVFSGEVDRLEAMMQMMGKGEEGDPEMQKIDAVMDKILDIQHPDRVRERLKEKSILNKEKVYPVTTSAFRSSVSLLYEVGKKMQPANQFFGIEKAAVSEETFSVEAVVHQSQSLTSGAVVKFRILSDVFVGGLLIPKGTFVFGIATLNDERLEVEISSIRYGSSVFPVQLQVYDMDGLPGIYIPGAISRDVAKGSLDNAAQTLEITSLDPSLKAQAANAGVSAAKRLLSKKAKLVKVMVKAGYRVLLTDK